MEEIKDIELVNFLLDPNDKEELLKLIEHRFGETEEESHKVCNRIAELIDTKALWEEYKKRYLSNNNTL